MMLFAAVLTGMRSRSRSSLKRLFSSVNRLNFKSAIDCLVFLICDGSPTSRDVYWGILNYGNWIEVAKIKWVGIIGRCLSDRVELETLMIVWLVTVLIESSD